VRLLVKNLDRGMPDSVVRKEPESLYFHYEGVTQLRSVRRDKTTPKTAFLPHFLVSMAPWPELPKV